jgi:hypothetical protein
MLVVNFENQTNLKTQTGVSHLKYEKKNNFFLKFSIHLTFNYTFPIGCSLYKMHNWIIMIKLHNSFQRNNFHDQPS